MPDLAKFVFDAHHAKQILDELALRLKAFNSLESVPPHIRDVIDEALAGRGFEFAYTDTGSTLAAATGERLIKVQLAGKLHSALATLRTMQRDDVIGHA